MKAICVILFVMSLASGAYAQSQDSLSLDSIQEEKLFFAVEEQAYFPGGIPAMTKFLKENIVYPKQARKKKIQGRVYVKFIIERDGSVSNIEPLKNVDPELDAEAIRVVSTFPKWIPGKQSGRTVRSQFVLPIIFKLGK